MTLDEKLYLLFNPSGVARTAQDISDNLDLCKKVKQLIQEEKNALLDRLVMEKLTFEPYTDELDERFRDDFSGGAVAQEAYNQAVEENNQRIEKER